ALERPNARPRLARLATANIAGSTTAFRVVMTTDSNDRTVARSRVETARLSSSARGGHSSALAKAISTNTSTVWGAGASPSDARQITMTSGAPTITAVIPNESLTLLATKEPA